MSKHSISVLALNNKKFIRFKGEHPPVHRRHHPLRPRPHPGRRGAARRIRPRVFDGAPPRSAQPDGRGGARSGCALGARMDGLVAGAAGGGRGAPVEVQLRWVGERVGLAVHCLSRHAQFQPSGFLSNFFFANFAVFRIRIRCLFEPWIRDP
jgi:hypothetical protein